MTAQQHNWAGNYTYSTTDLHCPETVAQIQELVARSSMLRVLGSRHSFNGIADSTAQLVSLERLGRVLGIDAEQRTVTIEGGVRYGMLAQQLHRAGYALHNMASLPHISVAGACATATHGSGDGNGNLATAVAALEFVAADGTLVALSRAQHGDEFAGAVVALGSLGVVTQLTLDIEPTFAVQQDVYDQLPMAELTDHFEEIMASAYSVSLFTDWQGDHVNQAWLKRRVADDQPLDIAPTFFGARPARREQHPIAELPAAPCTPQLGAPGAWCDRLPHFRMEETPSSGAELQSEYFVPRQHAVAAIRAVAQLGQQLAPQLMISEVRSIAADALWMSMCYEQDSVALHFTWQRNWPEVSALLPLIEAQLAPFGARPHWGKVFTMPPAPLQACYTRLPDFRALLQTYDPQGKFRNAFVERYVFGDDE